MVLGHYLVVNHHDGELHYIRSDELQAIGTEHDPAVYTFRITDMINEQARYLRLADKAEWRLPLPFELKEVGAMFMKFHGALYRLNRHISEANGTIHQFLHKHQ